MPRGFYGFPCANGFSSGILLSFCAESFALWTAPYVDLFPCGRRSSFLGFSPVGFSGILCEKKEEDEAMTVSIDTILAMVFSLLVSFVLPIVLLVVLKRRFQVSAMGALVGAGGFILFVLVLEQILHWAVLSFTPVGTIPWAYVLYGCLAAGVFEETGRLVIDVYKRQGQKRAGLRRSCAEAVRVLCTLPRALQGQEFPGAGRSGEFLPFFT